ncbi:MAG: polyprenol monophosphomannose synthase [Actinomycetaceae bacterium]|nr:polyprenol monophosphomannose synthase [Actinomycetaceae bacterium]
MTTERLPAIVIVPTYNERFTLPVLVDSLLTEYPNLHLLIVDDDSPDGTGEWARQKERNESRVNVLHRPAKSGLASAYLDGFAWAIERGYEFLMQMDADGSHRIGDVGKLLTCIEADDAVDLVIGSRWIPGGQTRGWGRHRVALSRAGNIYIQLMLGLDISDATAGFRVYRASLLRRLPVKAIESRGYGFQVEMTYKAHRAGASITEVPIVFLERRAGQSKMSADIIIEEFAHVTRWGMQRLISRLYPQRR